MYDSDGDNERMSQQLRQSNKVDDKKEKNELQLLGEPPHYALVRVTQKNFFVDINLKKYKKNNSNTQEMIYFSLYEQGIQVDKLELGRCIPEKVIKYFVQRSLISDHIVILDALSNNGSFLIQAALQESVFYVIGCESNQQLLKNSINNADVYGISSKIQQIHGSFQNLRKVVGMVDVLFIQPSFQKQSYDINKLVPTLDDIIYNGLRLTNNIIIVLPYELSINAITAKLTCIYNACNQYLDIIEIQLIQIDGQIIYYVVYIGVVANLQNQDKFEILSKFLNQDSQSQQFSQPTYQLLKKLNEQNTFRQIMDLVLLSQNESQQTTHTILQHFIHFIIKKDWISRQEIELLYEQDSVSFLLQHCTPQYQQLQYSTESFNPNVGYRQQVEQIEMNPKPPKQQFISFNDRVDEHQNQLLKQTENQSLLAILKQSQHGQSESPVIDLNK